MKISLKVAYYLFFLAFLYVSVACAKVEKQAEYSNKDSKSTFPKKQRPETIYEALYGDWKLKDRKNRLLDFSFRGDTALTQTQGTYIYTVKNGLMKFTSLQEKGKYFEKKILEFFYNDTLVLEASGGHKEVYVRQKNK